MQKPLITISRENMQISPELAVTWTFSKMLCEPAFLQAFSQKYLGEPLDVESATIHREKRYANRAIDVCVFLHDKLGKKYAIAVEAKTHWPDKEQLLSSISLVEGAHPDYTKVTGVYLLATTDSKQLEALSHHDWLYPILTVKELAKQYCIEGIENNYPIRLANDLQALVIIDC